MDEASYVSITYIVQPTLGQDDCHASAGLEELKIPLDKQDIATNSVLPFAVRLLRQVVLVQDAGISDVACEGWIG